MDPNGPFFCGSPGGENPEKGNGKGAGRAPLARDATHRVTVVAVVVVLGVQVAIRIEVQVVRVVRGLYYRRPVVAVATNVVRRTVPVTTIHEESHSDSILEEYFKPRYAP